MGGPQRAPQEAPQPPAGAVASEDFEELKRQLVATQEQLAKVLERLPPSAEG